MTTIAELAIPTESFALEPTIQSLPESELRVESVVVDDSVRTAPLIWFGNTDAGAVEETLEDDPTVEQFRRLLERPDGDAWLFRIRYAEAATPICSAVYANDGTVLEAEVTNGRWAVTLLFPHREGVSDAVSDLEDRDARVDVRRMVEAHQNKDLEMATTLTDPQREAIAEAYRRGYYNVPREISLEELASELEISHQALSERLRRANRVLASEQLESSASGLGGG
ncbi:helix-turn-helix domain-containing protein [Natronococcus occultus]|uniref:Putative DNA binding protein n=1 Tax=Natronococcus occultus SP4 TaxID=694430 RepID=L0K366_9EURY|nr:helix-turn-helix domain-containing protein [Natronococcus occultus]AGB38553.1 putative DNA binding protein [Natronococcus occultus SP4]